MPTARPASLASSPLAQKRIEDGIIHLSDKVIRLSEEANEAEAFNAAIKSDSQVIKIPHHFKTAVGPITTNKTALIHVDSFSKDLSAIKINQFSEERPPVNLRNMYILTFIYKIGRREYYIVKNNNELIKMIDDLRKLGSLMNIVEYSISKGMIQSCDRMIFDVEYWGKYQWETADTHGIYYDKVNDPLVLDQFTKLVLPMQNENKSDKPLVVVDMGGGKGRLADKLISSAIYANVNIHYVLVEPCLPQVTLAKEKLKKYNDAKKCKIEVVHSTIEEFAPTDKAHCVISSGGTINMNVASRKKAIENVNNLSILLKPDGILIATGQTAIVPKSKHFKAAGMKVLSYAVPCPTPVGYEKHSFLEIAKVKGGFFGHYQRYVAQKAPAPKSLWESVSSHFKLPKVDKNVAPEMKDLGAKNRSGLKKL